MSQMLLIMNLVLGGMQLTQRLEYLRMPAPVFQHLAGCFVEIFSCAGTVKTCELGLSNEVVDSMAKLVEQYNYLVVLQISMAVFLRLVKIAQETSRGIYTIAFLISKPLSSINHLSQDHLTISSLTGLIGRSQNPGRLPGVQN